jgi:hypothetical protein
VAQGEAWHACGLVYSDERLVCKQDNQIKLGVGGKSGVQTRTDDIALSQMSTFACGVAVYKDGFQRNEFNQSTTRKGGQVGGEKTVQADPCFRLRDAPFEVLDVH